MKHDSIFKFIFLSSRTFLLLWSFLFQQIWASHEFYRGPKGELIVDHTAAIPSGVELRKAKSRVHHLARKLANARGIDPDLRKRAADLQSKVLRLPYSGQRLEDGFNEVRDMLASMQALHGEEIKKVISEDEYLNKITTLPQLRDLHKSILTPENTPPYCGRYPLIDREGLNSFYGQNAEGEGLECYSPGGNNVGLDFNNIAQAMLSVEGNLYEKESKNLKNKLVNKSISGIMEEAQSYSGLFPNTEFPSQDLLKCANSHARRKMDNDELSQQIKELEENEDQKIEKLNDAFGGADKRLESFIANQVREAIILGNLYQITSQAKRHNEGQVARIGGDEREMFTPDVVDQCLKSMEEKYNFSYPDQHNFSFATRLEQRCRSFVEDGKFASRSECLESYRSLMQNADELEREQNRCYYQASGRESSAPKFVKADLLIPMMSASVEANPLLFDRKDNRSFIPFVSSESNYIPSELAKSLLNLEGAHSLSQKVEALLATNPENPKEAIDKLLASPEAINELKGVIAQAKSNEGIKEKFQQEIANYKDELAESATNVCENDGEHLHQFPNLVEDVIANDLAKTSDPNERKKLLARSQAAQCWLLKEDPPEEEGGLSGAYIALGVGAIALGLVPGVGLIASAALMGAGTALTATDSYLRFDHSRDRLNATTAAFQGGWADSQKLLLSAEKRTNAHTMLLAEALTVGVLDVASPAARALYKGLSASDEVATAAVQGTKEVTAQPPAPYTSWDDNLYRSINPERNANRTVELGIQKLGDEEVPIRIKPGNYNHMREHDYPNGLEYVEDLVNNIGERKLDLDFLNGLKSDKNGSLLFKDIIEKAEIAGDTISLNDLLALTRKYKTPTSDELTNGINKILDTLPNIGFRKNKPTSLYPEDARLDDVIDAIKNNEVEISSVAGKNNVAKVVHENREYRVHFCLKKEGCGCGNNGTCQRDYGDITSMYPDCGPGIYMLNTRSSLTDSLINADFQRADYITNRDFVANGITGAAVGSFNDGLIREVKCK